MTKRSGDTNSFLTRLKRNEAGNTLALTAAAVIPLIGLIGGGVDMSRAYLAKSRLQQACDAGALAGRREMGSGSWNSASQTAAVNFFDLNFADGSYGTISRARSYSESSQVVTGTASVTVPTSIMKIFGSTGISIAVSCSSEMKIPNTDVMFVLDTTGSMASKAVYTDTQTKIEALKSAVRSFYTNLSTASGANTQLRYGFVPYASNVNVGYLLQRDWMVDNWTYQSREKTPNGYSVSNNTGNWTYNGTGSVTGWVTVSSTSVSSSFNCNAPADTVSTTTGSPSTTTTTDSNGVITTSTVTSRTTNGIDYTATFDQDDPYQTGKGNNKTWVYPTSGTCTIVKKTWTNYKETKTETTTQTPQYTWTYKQVPYAVSALKGSKADGTMTGGSITATVGDGYTDTTVTWDGCIEERDTVVTTNYSPIPSAAYDLDIDLVPYNNNTRWRPAMPGLVYGRSKTGTSYWDGSFTSSPVTSSTNYLNWSSSSARNSLWYTCAPAARKLATVSSLTDLNTYLATLTPNGYTYHDIGFLWGARLISADGIFSSENTTTPNGGSISRHLVFMTDGGTDVHKEVYGAYGLAALDRRQTNSGSEPTDSELTTLTESRLSALCTATKNKNITVWVVAFGTSLDTKLTNCASPGRAYQANNSSELNTAFTQIAAQISQLRLTE